MESLLVLSVVLTCGVGALAAALLGARKRADLAEQRTRAMRERIERALLDSKTGTWDMVFPDGTLANSYVITDLWQQLGHEEPLIGGESGAQRTMDTIFLQHPDERQLFVSTLESFLAGRETEWNYEGRTRLGDGSDRWYFSRGLLQRDPVSGRALRLTGSSIDITDRKRMEKALRDSEQGFRALFENAAVGMTIGSVDGVILDCNDKVCTFLGRERKDVVGHSFAEFMVPGEVPMDRSTIDRILDGKLSSFARDKRYLRSDGSSVWGHANISVIQRDATGAAIRTVCIVQDIAERKALEQDLQRSKDRLDLAVRASHVSIFEFDMPDGHFESSRGTRINFWEPLGYDPADMPETFGSASALILSPQDQQRVSQAIATYLAGATPNFEIEHQVRAKDGSVRWKLVRGLAVRNPSGMAIRFVGSHVDITALKLIEAELQKSREAAESANRAKDEFLANVSHEIRTPMNAILGMTELALDSAGSEQQRQLLGTVRSATQNLLGVINDLLDFSKMTAGKLALDEADFSLRAELDDTVRALAPRAHRKGLDLRLHVSPAVPDAVRGDAGRLRQILLNLIGNAVKFTLQGEVVVEVTMAALRAPTDDFPTLAFTVRDTGIGIARDKQLAIFRAFEQEDSSTTRKFGGTGLGLTISAQLAALMGGAITVDSAPGEGSTFAFTARFARAVRPALADPPRTSVEKALPVTRASARPRESVHGASAPTLRVLVAEDNELNAVLLEELLRRRGHLAQFVGDGRAAVTQAEVGTFELLLLDLHLPELDGFAVVEAIRARERGTGKHLPIIALTARSSSQDRERCLAVGMDDFLTKPIDPDTLWETVDRVVAAYSPMHASSRSLA